MSEVMLRLINGFLMCEEIMPKSPGAAYDRVRLIIGILR